VKRKWDTEKEDLAEVQAEDQVEDSAAEAISAAQKKCIRQFAQIAARNAKFLSSQAMIQTESQDQFIAGTATKSTNQQDGSKFFNFLVK
jgi:hypothetical protein